MNRSRFVPAVAAPSRSNRNIPRARGEEIYELRHRIENFIMKINKFLAVATRRDKAAADFGAFKDLRTAR